jgi:hypothetical protein
MSEQEGNENSNSCNLQQFKRNLYFYGKLMSVRDFKLEQDYMNGKRRLVNRFVYGPGIIRGFGELSLKNTGGNIEIEFTKGGVAFDCCGNEIVVPDGKVRPVYLGAEKLTAMMLTGGQYYLYLAYSEIDAEPVPTAANASSCDEKCCNSRKEEDFVVIASENPPDSNTIDCSEIPADYHTEEELREWIDQQIKSLLSCEDRRVFLAAIIKNKSISNEDSDFVDIVETLKYRSIVYNNQLLSDLLRCHISTDNPHNLGLEVEEEKVEFSNGIITINKADAITLDADKDNHEITIGESHSARTDNPHNVTAGQVEALESVDGVTRDDGGNVDLAPDNSITITPDTGNHRITIGETHSARTDNPHGVTAAQVGALVSVDGVSNPGDNVDLVQADSITITPDNDANTITIGEGHSALTGNLHQTTHEQINDVRGIFEDENDDIRNKHISNNDAIKWNKAAEEPVGLNSINYVENPGGNIDLVGKNAIEIIPLEDNVVNDVVEPIIIITESHSTNKDNPHETTAEQVGALSTQGGFITGPIHIRTEEWNALTGEATKTYGVMGRLTEDLETGSDYRTAGVVGVSEIPGTHGVYAQAPKESHALYVEGSALFTGPKTGYVVDIFKNASGKTLKTGDVVKLKGTPLSRFFGEGDKIPVPEVTLADKESDNCTIGIVDRKAIPDEKDATKKTKTGDPTSVKNGEELYVVTLGTYAHCKVDAANAPIAVGDLLTSSKNPGFAQKAMEPQIGTIIGKALEPLEKGTGSIAVFVNIQ